MLPAIEGENTMEPHVVRRGVWQGSAMGNPALCIPLMKCIRKAVADCNGVCGGSAHILAYADDFVVIAEGVWPTRFGVRSANP